MFNKSGTFLNVFKCNIHLIIISF